jgi:hypothetical protein
MRSRFDAEISLAAVFGPPAGRVAYTFVFAMISHLVQRSLGAKRVTPAREKLLNCLRCVLPRKAGTRSRRGAPAQCPLCKNPDNTALWPRAR